MKFRIEIEVGKDGMQTFGDIRGALGCIPLPNASGAIAIGEEGSVRDVDTHHTIGKWEVIEDAPSPAVPDSYAHAPGPGTSFYDYDKQAWVLDGKYARCHHPAEMNCGCYGKAHEGEAYVSCVCAPTRTDLDAGMVAEAISALRYALTRNDLNDYRRACEDVIHLLEGK